MGGIGNQLFQINRALSIKLVGGDVEVIHLGNFKKFIHLIINHSNHKDWININKLCNQLKISYRRVNFYDLLILSFFFISKKLNLYSYFDIPLDNLDLQQSRYDIGYFQKKNHFNHKSLEIITDNLIKLLSINLSTNQKKKIIGFHVRGGDFLKNKNNKLIKKTPNFELLKKYLKKFKKEKSKFFIITNDTKIILRFHNNINKSIIHSSDELSDFLKLVQCNLMFVSQSTYCFWAYLLSKKIYNCEILNLEDWYFKDIVQAYFK